MSIRGLIDAEMLSNVLPYFLGKDLETLTDFYIKQEINHSCSTVKNNNLSDFEALFPEEIRINLKEDDIEAQLLKYFARFNKILGNNGLQSVMGNTKANDHKAIVQAKNRTRF